MRALITNDDGIDSVGLRTLVRVALAAGLEVTVAAPHTERSGSSASLSALEVGGRLLIESRELDGFNLPVAEDTVRADLGDAVDAACFRDPVLSAEAVGGRRPPEAFAVHATPAMIVLVGVRGAFGLPPDVVLSGVNHGPNTGQAVLHSGTVGAALTARSHGVPALALSLASARPTHWETAARVTDQALGWLLTHLTDHSASRTPVVLNVNVPDIAPEQLRGLRPATLASFGAVQAEFGERGEGYITTTFTDINAEAEPGTDVALLRAGWATATALTGPTEASTIGPRSSS
ncbi:5'/3'-nucleotidase SurE [Frankia sp. QA3]|uniref:5'/3'-nucleotidase SurE n=1 Tax=Frankia sp. QA3 TaxID=710111 RepID=UPI000269C252|nr:5'/3'-nucleotidase SurE [Frankia sp. QA3]EIV92813.1 putative acid phosphatase [Frankia sp. QA3]